jgi:hypothetical protein
MNCAEREIDWENEENQVGSHEILLIGVEFKKLSFHIFILILS